MDLDQYDIHPLVNKWELAIRLYPDSTKANAVHALSRHIARKPGLREKLQALDCGNCKKFNDAQVRLIVDSFRPPELP